VHEFSHNATLRVAKVSRKQAGTSVPAFSLDEMGQALDGA
jgi:hypothetical protein